MNLLVNVYNPEDYRFFKRFYPEFTKRGWEVSYLANGLLPFILLKLEGETAYLARKVSDEFSVNFSNNFSVLTGRLTESEAGKNYSSIINKLEYIYAEAPWDIAIIPSGRLVNHVAISDFCDNKSIRKIFVGYGNIPNRTFVDPEGTDMASFLYKKPEVLDKWAELDSFEEWRQDYIREKLQSHSIGQARSVNFKLKLKKNIQILSCYFERLFGIVGENSYYFGRGQKVEAVDLNFSDNLPDKYVFFPMQVSTDAQIILNYDGNSIQGALDIMVARSRERGIPLVVKPHPAEIDADVMHYLNEVAGQGNIVLRNDNTFELIQGADEVWTINSTVGLESKIVGTPVTFEGNSIYREMEGPRIAAYVMKYLAKIEYFSDDEITAEQFDDFFDESRYQI